MTTAAAAPSVGHDAAPPSRSAHPTAGPPVKRLLVTVGVFVGSTLGWKAGEYVGTMTAYFASVLGSGLGAWLAIRKARELE